jgi:hypothetical protein
MVSNPVLVVSSLVYVSNVLTCWIMGEITYAKRFGALVATSLIVHINTNIYTIIIDKVSIACVVGYGGYTYFQSVWGKNKNILGVYLPLATFITVCIFYVVGYLCKGFCFDTEHKICTRYHVLLHVISSIGHHAILLLL